MFFLYFFSFYRKILPWVTFKRMKELWMLDSQPCLSVSMWTSVMMLVSRPSLESNRHNVTSSAGQFILPRVLTLSVPSSLPPFFSSFPASLVYLSESYLTSESRRRMIVEYSISRGQWLARVALCRAPSTSTIKIKIVSFSQRGMFPNQVHSVSKKLDGFVEQIILI